MSELTNDQLHVFCRQFPTHEVQKSKFKGKWNYRVMFHSDLPRSSIDTFADIRDLKCEWTFYDRPMLYFNDLLLHDMLRSVAQNTALSQVIKPENAKKLDDEWKLKFARRIIFSRWQCPLEADIIDMMGSASFELVTTTNYRFLNGVDVREKVVLAVLTDDISATTKLQLALNPALVESA